eukprot:GILI01008720.1.p1 GENE.GILI01008720.1~~GILI01008720.1.p1  ORF type:complete len:452 (-),score=40.29 GILI01008720.1:62-1417(-)
MNTLSLVFVLLLASFCQGFTWHNWDGRQVCHPQELLFPESEQELLSLVKNVSTSHGSIKVVGAGHSFSPIALTEGVLVSLDKYNRVLEVDGTRVTVQAGIRLKDLNQELEKRGLALENLGAIGEQSVAGATQTGTHGTGRSLGSISTQIVAMRLISGDGEILDLSSTSAPHLFNAARVGLGALGIVSTVTLQTVPLFNMKRTVLDVSLSAIVTHLPLLQAHFPRWMFWWQPYTSDTVQVTTFEPSDSAITGCWPPPRTLPKPYTIILAGGHNISALIRSECVDVSYKALSNSLSPTASKYTEMEMFVPIEVLPSALESYISIFTDLKSSADLSAGELNAGVRFIRGDDILLSPMQGRDSAVLSCILRGNSTHTGAFSEFFKFSSRLQSTLMSDFGGRPHWGKMHYATFNQLKSVYPKIFEFKQLMRQLDPLGIFVNEHVAAILDENRGEQI